MKTVGEYCFQKSGLTEIIIPYNVTKIKRGAFSKCYNLKKVVLPYGLETISDSCFRRSGLEEIEVPKSVKMI